MRVHYARTPTRIDLAGGWTDVPRFAERVPGAVLNFAITLYSHVRIRETSGGGRGADVGRSIGEDFLDRPIAMYSQDYDEREEVPSIRHIRETELTGNFGLVKAALRRRGSRSGLEICTRSDAPPGSGLGTSASMGVALIGALGSVAGVPETPDRVAETAFALETEELRILSGKQDHYAAALGGVQYMSFRGPWVQSVAVPLSAPALADLQRRLVLVYTGRSRLSSDVHRHVVARFEAEDARFLVLLESLADLAAAARDALLRGDMDDVGKCVRENWGYQRELYDGIATPDMEDLATIGRGAGAIGMKACGAGGGGCLVFVCEDGMEGRVAAALGGAGAHVLPFDIAPQGLLWWSREAS
jgi:D-glycero-alpha-D-manno-heptose-7-phosphate kinase